MNSPGYITLVAVLIIGAMALSISVTTVLIGLDASRMQFAFMQSRQSHDILDACAETALMRIWNDEAYTGTDTLNIGGGTCSYTVQDTGGENRTISLQSSLGGMVRKSIIQLDDLIPFMHIVSWQDVADF